MSANDRQVAGSHYKKADGAVQHWDLISDAFGPSYLVGCATKYLFRWRDKNGIQDLEKSLHYIEKLMEVLRKPARPHTIERMRHDNLSVPGYVGMDELIACKALFVAYMLWSTGGSEPEIKDTIGVAHEVVLTLIAKEKAALAKKEETYAPIAQAAFESRAPASDTDGHPVFGDEELPPPTAAQLHPL